MKYLLITGAMAILLLGFGSPALAQSPDFNTNQWTNLRSVVEPEEGDGEIQSGEIINQGLTTEQSISPFLPVKCDSPNPALGELDCKIRFSPVENITSRFSDLPTLYPKSMLVIFGQGYRVTLGCEANACMFANPTMTNCALLASQSKTTGQPLLIEIEYENTSQAENAINVLMENKYASVTMGETPLRSIRCTFE